MSPVLKSAKLENREKKVIVIVYDSTLTAPLPGRYLKQCIGGEGEAKQGLIVLRTVRQLLLNTITTSSDK